MFSIKFLKEIQLRQLHVIMPMNGLGIRFKNEGIETPKPMILVDGIPLFLKALQSLKDLRIPTKITMILAPIEKKYGFEEWKKKYIPSSNIIYSNQTTKGAVETCMLAKEHIKENDCILLLDCDLHFQSSEYLKLIEQECLKPSIDAALLTFQSNNPRYSYAELHDDRVQRTAEKQAISSNAIAGAYFFSRASYFLDAAEILMKTPPMNEYYISHLYNILISRGKIIKAKPVSIFYSFGTPEELRDYVEKQRAEPS